MKVTKIRFGKNKSSLVVALLVASLVAPWGAPSSTAALGTLKYGYTGGGLVSLNPIQITSGTQKVVAPLLFDTLVKIDQTGKLVPSLAESWSSSKDQKTWTFNLRTGVTYHNGRRFSAHDVMYNLQWISNPANKSSQANEVGKILKYNISGMNKISIVLKDPNSQFPGSLVFIYMADILNIKDSRIKYSANGTGPYKVTEFVSDDHVYMVANSRYWGDAPKLDGIKIMRSPDATSALLSLQSGALDMVWNVAPGSIPALRSNANIDFLNANVFAGVHVLMLDTKSAPFNNVKARQALSYALDRATIVKTAFGGVGEVSLTSTPLGTKDPSYKSGLTNYTFDLDKAKALFAEAGIKSGDTLTFWTLAGRRFEWVAMAQILQSDLKKIGINLDIQPQETASWLGKFYPYPKDFPNTIVANFLSPAPINAYQMNVYTTGGCECKWDNKTYDGLMKSALAATDATAYNNILGQMQTMYNQEQPSLVVLTAANITAYKKTVKGAWLLGEGTPQLAGASLG